MCVWYHCTKNSSLYIGHRRTKQLKDIKRERYIIWCYPLSWRESSHNVNKRKIYDDYYSHFCQIEVLYRRRGQTVHLTSLYYIDRKVHQISISLRNLVLNSKMLGTKKKHWWRNVECKRIFYKWERMHTPPVITFLLELNLSLDFLILIIVVKHL
jgi:hypothetical protein